MQDAGSRCRLPTLPPWVTLEHHATLWSEGRQDFLNVTATKIHYENEWVTVNFEERVGLSIGFHTSQWWSKLQLTVGWIAVTCKHSRFPISIPHIQLDSRRDSWPGTYEDTLTHRGQVSLQMLQGPTAVATPPRSCLRWYPSSCKKLRR